MENQGWEWDPTAVSNYQIHVTQSNLHKVLSPGHLAVNKTLEPLQECFYWYGQKHDVQD